MDRTNEMITNINAAIVALEKEASRPGESFRLRTVCEQLNALIQLKQYYEAQAQPPKKEGKVASK